MNTSYKIECWGAKGGGWGIHADAPGGYSGGWKNIQKDQILYVCCGGKGIDASHDTDGTSYNGGGIGSNGDGGGGATHIATATGLLRELVDNKSTVICVAGGAGSNGGSAEYTFTKYMSGGGLVGLGSPTLWGYTNITKGDTGGTQEGCGPDGIKGGFGYGGRGYGAGGNGGGGWYGGNGSGDGDVSESTHGGGGSGYIGGLTNATTIDGGKTFPKLGGGTEQGHFDNGCALISWISPSL